MAVLAAISSPGKYVILFQKDPSGGKTHAFFLRNNKGDCRMPCKFSTSSVYFRREKIVIIVIVISHYLHLLPQTGAGDCFANITTSVSFLILSCVHSNFCYFFCVPHATLHKDSNILCISPTYVFFMRIFLLFFFVLFCLENPEVLDS